MDTNGYKGRAIDHLVYTVFDLDKSMDDFETRLGIRPIFGGYHQTFGTKNALINLDSGIYLELLASDNTNKVIKKPRWMGVDVLTKEQLTRWALKSTDLELDSRILKKHHPDMGRIMEGSRTMANSALLQWELSKPLPLPEVELIPFCIDWGSSEIHPHQALPDMGCTLIELYGTHPNPKAYNKVFAGLGIDFRVEKSPQICLKLVLESPRGTVIL